MKTYLTYGFIMTLAGALLGLGLFFGGFHSDPAKLKLAQNLGYLIGFVIGIACLLLGMREKRAATPPEKSWGYGSAFGTGVMISLFSSLFSAIYNYAYFAYINPGFSELFVEFQIMEMEAKKFPTAHIDSAMPMLEMIARPGVMTAMGLFGGFLILLVLSLIVAAFVKNRPVTSPPTV
ncbi:MAG TPA: DUF4199 domain-containing protein [Opitutaceae bacterium]|nr:DUF4199 domain-containing protein [Opitutaceae bacterium]